MNVTNITKNKLRDYPEYVKCITATHYEVDPDIGFPIWIKRFGLSNDQYAAEIAAKCCAMEVKECVALKNDDVRLFIRIKGSRRWRLNNLKPGKGWQQGSKDFRKYYNWWKGIQQPKNGIVVSAGSTIV